MNKINYNYIFNFEINYYFFRSLVLSVILIFLYGCNSEEAFNDNIIENRKELVNIQILPVKNITLGVSDLKIAKGGYQAFVAIGFYSDDSSENISDEVFWSSTFSEIATITEIGIAKGLDVGITSIKAIKDGIISNELSLTVTTAALESIQITPAVVSLAKGNSQQYTAMGFYSDETSRELTQEVSWRSRDTSIATIS
ncbi:Ig-like domain-containing protein, partial [Aliivibrio fischeri]|uniref:Ig-like domain-containing protein n=1 Tax=Aliivibrio fischeri TaxID=668 RepID=UPI000AF62720